MLALEKIVWLHCEPSTYCNAFCPACPRNNQGYGLSDKFTLTNLTLEAFQQALDQLPNLQTVQMCGNFGDPIANPDIKQMIEICKDKQLTVRIHTNGSFKTIDWWQDLAQILAPIPHAVIFGIDGLEGVHEIYRQGTVWNKIIDNAKAFIGADGTAEWQFILFKHNVHQVKDCMRLSQKLGFKKFYTTKSIRIPEPARHFITGKEFIIERVDDFLVKESFDVAERTVTPNDCMHLNIPSVYLNANGFLNPCCYLHKTNYEDNEIDSDIMNNRAGPLCIEHCGTKKLQ